MGSPQSHVHHYVPRWYQRRFLKTGQFQFYYLDLRPDASRDNKIGTEDRKSTRLNSSHVEISYAVFCLKKKKSLSNSNGRVVVNAFTAPGGGLLTDANPAGTGTLVFVTGAEATANPPGCSLLSRRVPGT